MFSLQQIFGKGDRFYGLLEEAAKEADESVRLVTKFLASPRKAGNRDDLVLARRKQRKIAEQIREELVRTFVTGLDREDIEALSLALHRIPKTVEKFTARLVIAEQHVEEVDFNRQAELMEKGTAVVLAMVQQLRDIQHLQKVKDLNDKLHYVENEADQLINELLKDLYSGKYDALRVVIIRDLYEMMEKVIDRCRDAGNVVMHIVLKNS